MVSENSYSQLNNAELMDLKATVALKNFKRTVNNVMLSEIPDDEIDYWIRQLKTSHKLLCNTELLNQKVSHGNVYGIMIVQQPPGRFRETFLVAELESEMSVLLARLEKRKLKLNALTTNSDNNSDSKSSNTDIQGASNMETLPSASGTDDLLSYKDISLQLPEFYGENFEEWLKFSKVFTELVHNNAQMPISTKLDYLREKVKNTPRKLISYLIAETDSNYELAWKMLEKRYGNRRIQFTSKLDCLLDMKMMQSDNYLSVQKMHDTAKECIYLMKKHLDHDIGESADEIFAHLIIRKMDVNGRALYEQHVRKTKSIQKLEDVLEFLDQQAEILENLEEISNETAEKNIRDANIDGPC